MEALRQELQENLRQNADINRRINLLKRGESALAEINAKTAYDWVCAKNISASYKAHRNDPINVERGPLPPHVVLDARCSPLKLNDIPIYENCDWLMLNEKELCLVLDAIKSGL